MEKKQDSLKQQVSKLKQSISAVDYLTKVPEEIRIANGDKLSSAETELERLNDVLISLRSMM